MTPENVEDDLFADRRATGVWTFADTPNGRCSVARESLVTFKFGGTSLLGAERMRHAADLVRPVAQFMQVVVVVSAMKGVTDRLLGIAQALGEGNSQQARSEAEAVLHLHLGILPDLALDSDDHHRVPPELNSLGRDLPPHPSPRNQSLSASAPP